VNFGGTSPAADNDVSLRSPRAATTTTTTPGYYCRYYYNSSLVQNADDIFQQLNFEVKSPAAANNVSLRSPHATTTLRYNYKYYYYYYCITTVVSNCGRFDSRLTHFRRHVLHWLDVTDRIRFRLCIQVYKC